VSEIYSRDLPLGSHRHSRISSLCVYARGPFVYKPSVNLEVCVWCIARTVKREQQLEQTVCRAVESEQRAYARFAPACVDAQNYQVDRVCVSEIYSRELPLGSHRHSRISSLCVCARVPFVYKPSESVRNMSFENCTHRSGRVAAQANRAQNSRS